MLRNLVFGIATLIVAGSIAAGGWWFAAGQGWLPGRADAPRAENFKRALDAHLARTSSGPYARPCAPVQADRQRDGAGPKDIRWDWSPASFRHVVDPRVLQSQMQAPRYTLLAKQGFFTPAPLGEGAVEYTLTWKGMAASPMQSCIQFASGVREAEVLSHEKKRSENGVDVYEVVARARHTGLEPWAQTPEFRQAFGDGQLNAVFEPQPVTYQLARTAGRWEVISEQGRSVVQRAGSRPEAIVKLVGSLSPEKVRGALEAWLASPQGLSAARVCLRLPDAQQADEISADPTRPGQEALTYTYYHLMTRQTHQQEPLRGYLLMQKLVDLGLATAEPFGVASFRDMPAVGAVRFTPGAAFLDQYSRTRERCLPLGTLALDQVVHFDQPTEANASPQFLARVKARPLDERAAKILEAFPHYVRMQEVGAVLRGSLQFQDANVTVANGSVLLPVWHPDPAEARLPVIDAPPPPPPTRGAKPAPPLATVGTELIARQMVSAINARDINARRALLHPEALQCTVGDSANQWALEVQKQFRFRIGEFRTTLSPVTELPWRERYDYPVTPTHRLQLLFDRPGEPVRSYAGSVDMLLALHEGRWLEVPGCPKGSVPRRAEGISSPQRVQALVAGMQPSLRREITDLMRQGRRTDAIRRYQQATGEDVLTGHDVVDQVMRAR